MTAHPHQSILVTVRQDEPADGHPDAHVHVGGLPVIAHRGDPIAPRPATWIPYVRYRLVFSDSERGWLLLAEDDMTGWMAIARVLTAPAETAGHDLVAQAGDAPLLNRDRAYLITHQPATDRPQSTCTMTLTATAAADSSW